MDQSRVARADQRILLGVLTPSSNTRLEPITAAMLAEIPEASAHFGRFRVTEIALSDAALAQFDDTEILRAAALLADAKVHVDRLERHLGRLARFRVGRAALPPDHRSDRHPRLHLGPRAERGLPPHRREALRPGYALPRRRAGEDRRELRRRRLRVRRRAAPGLAGQLVVLDRDAGPAARDDARRGESAARRDHLPLHRAAERAARRGARARDRHPDVRHDRDGRLEVAQARRRRSEADRRWGRLFRDVA